MRGESQTTYQTPRQLRLVMMMMMRATIVRKRNRRRMRRRRRRRTIRRLRTRTSGSQFLKAGYRLAGRDRERE